MGRVLLFFGPDTGMGISSVCVRMDPKGPGMECHPSHGYTVVYGPWDDDDARHACVLATVMMR